MLNKYQSQKSVFSSWPSQLANFHDLKQKEFPILFDSRMFFRQCSAELLSVAMLYKPDLKPR